MKDVPSLWFRWLVVVTVASLTLVGSWLWFHFVRLQQHENGYNLMSCYPLLRDYHEAFNEYPGDLESLLAWGHPELSNGEGPKFCRGRRPLDSYNNPIHFESMGDRFVLASLGSDGEIDTDLWGARDGPATWKGSELARPPFSICGDKQSDTIYSDLGFHSACVVK